MAAGRLARTCEDVLEVLEADYYHDARVIFERAVQTLGKIPAQPHNEFRNSLNHLGRACLAIDDTDLDYQLLMARWHLAIAKRECSKLAIIHLEQHLGTTILLLENAANGISRRVRNRFRAISDERRDIIRAELRGDLNVNDRLEQLWAECNSFLEYLHETFSNIDELRRQPLPPLPPMPPQLG